MPAFPKPGFDFEYKVAEEITALRNYRDTKPGRTIPIKTDNNLGH